MRLATLNHFHCKIRHYCHNTSGIGKQFPFSSPAKAKKSLQKLMVKYDGDDISFWQPIPGPPLSVLNKHGINLILLFLDPVDESKCAVPDINGGTVTPPNPIAPGDKFTVACETGHTMTGTSTISCTDDNGRGKLSDLPTCTSGKFILDK